MPNETIIDGEVVALDESGRPSFNLLQNHGSSGVPLIIYVFDLLMLSGRHVMNEPLAHRRELLETKLLPRLREPVRYSPKLEAPLHDLIESLKELGFEGLVAKNRSSAYEPGLRSGAWGKMRVNRGQEFVIGGNTLGGQSFDALIFGYYEGDKPWTNIYTGPLLIPEVCLHSCNPGRVVIQKAALFTFCVTNQASDNHRLPLPFTLYRCCTQPQLPPPSTKSALNTHRGRR